MNGGPGWLCTAVALCLHGMDVAGAVLPDPTRPYQYDSAAQVFDYSQQAMEWNLAGIKITEQGRMAILNGKLVREGDTLDTATVEEIRPSEIILLHNHKRIAVRLLISDIKRPVPGNEKQ